MKTPDKKIFVTQALEHALKEKKQALKEAYIQANKDTDRLKTIKEWQILDWPCN